MGLGLLRNKWRDTSLITGSSTDMTTPLKELTQVSEAATHSSSESVPDFTDVAMETPTVSKRVRSPARNIFLHWSRCAFRVAALLAADVTAFVLLRAALRSLRSGVLSSFAGPSALANMVFPSGYLHVGPLIVALIIGLTLSGSYGPGDARRNSARLFAGVGLAVLLTLYGSFRTEPFFLVLLQVVVTALLFGVTLTAFRLIVDRIAAVIWTGPPPARTIVILGEGQGMDAQFDLEAILHSGSRFEVVETFPVQLADDFGTSLAEAIDSQGVDTVAMIGKFSGPSYSEIVDVSLTHGCRLITTPRSSGVVPRPVFVDGVRFIELTAPGLNDKRRWVTLAESVHHRLAHRRRGVALLVYASLILAATALASAFSVGLDLTAVAWTDAVLMGCLLGCWCGSHSIGGYGSASADGGLWGWGR